MLNKLLTLFDHIILLDLETTGFSPVRDEIIEMGAVSVWRDGVGALSESETDVLVRLSPGRRLPSAITQLTGITTGQLEERGVAKEEACLRLRELLDAERPLIAAYNAQFDLGFLYHFLRGFGQERTLVNAKFLDVMTVYKDRRDYPHRLENAVAAYSLAVQNTHRALDDARATFELLGAMENELDDLDRYVNLFGFNPKYGVSGSRISSVRYAPQPFGRAGKVYEQPSGGQGDKP